MDLLSFPSALLAVTVWQLKLKSPMYEVLPEIIPELLILNPLANPLADHEVGFRSAGTCMIYGLPGGYEDVGIVVMITWKR